MALELLTQYGTDKDARRKDRGKEGRAAIHHVVTAVKLRDMPSCIEFLEQNGFDLDSRDANGDTALHLALARGSSNVGAAPHLIKNGASVDIPNNDRVTCRTILGASEQKTAGMLDACEALQERDQHAPDASQSAAAGAAGGWFVQREAMRREAAEALQAATAPASEDSRRAAAAALCALASGSSLGGPC